MVNTAGQSKSLDMLSPEVRRARLLAWKGIDLVLDVGANAGQYALRLRRAGYRGRIVSFEPGGAAYVQLSARASVDALWDCHQLALGDRDGEAILNVAEDSEGSSLLQVLDREVQNSPGSGFVDCERVRVARVDTVLSEMEIAAERPYLKLDTQGSELAVLRGAPRALAAAAFVEAELSLVPLYRDGPLFQEIIDFLDERGFGLASLEGIDEERDTGHMLQVDAIFLRRDA